MTAHADRDDWPDADVYAASLTVCDHLPADQARTVLEALGLLTYDGFDARGRTNGAGAKFPRVRVGALDRKKGKKA